MAGREDAEAGAANVMPGGAAGGYVGAMVTGTVTNGHAHDVRLVRGMRAAGGFVGMAEAGGVAQLGSVDILGFDLNPRPDARRGAGIRAGHQVVLRRWLSDRHDRRLTGSRLA